jgi:hypothetical protein
MKKRLLKTYENVHTHSLEDFIYLMALNLEDALLTGGAVPGVDYQILDLYRISMPLAVESWKDKSKDLSFVTGYPEGHPLA